MAKERLSQKQKEILKLIFELEAHRQIFLQDLVPNSEKAYGLIGLMIKYFKFKESEILYNEEKKLDKHKEAIKNLNFSLVLKTLAEACNKRKRETSELKSIYRSVNNLVKKGYVKIEKTQNLNTDYILTQKGLDVAQSLM